MVVWYVGLLNQKAQTLHSTRITALAAEVSTSPFDKVGKLIQELIDNLQQEAADDMNHQGWCNKQVVRIPGIYPCVRLIPVKNKKTTFLFFSLEF